MNPSGPIPTRFEAVVLAAVAIILIVTLLVPPAVGLADNGDFYKMLSRFGLEHGAQPREDRYFSYVDPAYIRDLPQTAVYRNAWGNAIISSEIVFVAAAVGLNNLFHSGEIFYLRYLGAVHILVFLLGVYLLLWGTRQVQPTRRVLGILFAVVMFADVGYTSYFNSAFTETASFLFLLLLIGTVFPLILRRSRSPVWVVLYFCFSFLLCSSRYPNAVLFPFLALFGIVLAIRSRKMICGILSIALTIAGMWLLVMFVREAPAEYARFSIYNNFFNGLIRFSPTPSEDLREFGLDPALRKYAGTTYYQTDSAVYDAEAYREIEAKVTTSAIIRFYLRHPVRMKDAMLRSAALGLAIRPGYGNYEKSAGKAPGAVSRGFSLWSSFRDRLLPKSFWAVIAIIIVYAVCAFLPRKSPPEWSFRILILLLCALQFGMISCASEPSDIVRHMFLFNLLLDLMMLVAAVDILFFFGSRFLRSEIAEEAYAD